MNKRRGILGCFLFLTVSFLFSGPLENLVGTERAGILLSGESITQTRKTPGFTLAPAYGPLNELLAAEMRNLNPNTVIETLRIYTKPQEANREAWTGAERTALYNASLALSTLAGLQYFSTTRNKWRTFYENSAVIDSPDTKIPLGDPVFMVPPEKITVYARQEDLTFGDNIYKYTYHAEPDSFFFIQENMTSLMSGIIPAVGKNKLRSVVAIVDAGPYLVIYAAALAKVASFPGLGQQIIRSFSARADAILLWFFKRADAAYR